MSEQGPAYGREAAGWNAERVRRLRGHLGATQREFADALGTRQQTISEWETGASSPRAMARRLLHLLAEERGFYSTEHDASLELRGAVAGAVRGSEERADLEAGAGRG